MLAIAIHIIMICYAALIAGLLIYGAMQEIIEWNGAAANVGARMLAALREAAASAACHRHATRQQHAQRSALLSIRAGVRGLWRRRADRPLAQPPFPLRTQQSHPCNNTSPPTPHCRAAAAGNPNDHTPALSAAYAQRCFPSPGGTAAAMRLHSHARVYCMLCAAALHTFASAAAGAGMDVVGGGRPCWRADARLEGGMLAGAAAAIITLLKFALVRASQWMEAMPQAAHCRV